MSDAGILSLYDRGADRTRRTIARLVAEDEVEAMAAEAREAFVSLLPEMPYREQLEHTMFMATFGVFSALALYEAARERGIGVHQVGRALLAADFPALPGPPPPGVLEKIRRDAEASQRGAGDNEFVFEVVDGDADTDWGMNVTRCAVCHAFGNHAALDLVPYMCATDDVMSDAGDQGLRRTGTIGLGAHRCDFRYKQGGAPRRLAEHFPERIRTG
jgi:hypothetical protein